jgi:hypothetical protein
MTCERQCEANWGVHLAFYFGQPRIVQHSPSLESRGSDALDEGVTLGLRKRHSQKPLGVRLCDACDTCDASSRPLSALVFHHRQSVGVEIQIVLSFDNPTKFQTTRHTRHTCHKALCCKGFGSDGSGSQASLPSAKRHSLTSDRSLTWRANKQSRLTHRAGSGLPVFTAVSGYSPSLLDL